MSEVKIPEPEYMGCDSVGDIFAYTEAQLKAYGDDCAREALELAASIANDGPEEQSGEGTYVCTPDTIARAIRTLKEQLK
jgi:hypothetical protein